MMYSPLAMALRTSALTAALGLCVLGCSPETDKPVQTVTKAKPALEVIRPPINGLKKYVPKSNTPLPTLGGLAPKPVQPDPVKRKRLALTVRLLGSIQARGGTAADWIGFEPGERLFRAIWKRPTDKENKAPAKPIELRVKAKDPQQGTQWLGRTVSIRGYWMTPPEVTAHLDSTALPKPVELNRRKGQDLFDSVQQIRTRKMEAVGAKDKAKQQAPKLGGRGQSRASSGRVSLPVFYADEMSLKR